MNRVLQGRRQLLLEVRRLGSYRVLYIIIYIFCKKISKQKWSIYALTFLAKNFFLSKVFINKKISRILFGQMLIFLSDGF